MNPSKYLDESTLDELEKEGFFKKNRGEIIRDRSRFKSSKFKVVGPDSGHFSR